MKHSHDVRLGRHPEGSQPQNTYVDDNHILGYDDVLFGVSWGGLN